MDQELPSLLGEVHTGLLQNSRALTEPEVAGLLALRPGERVRTATRPLAHGLAPELPFGVHCPIATQSGARVEGIGTLLRRASVTGGRVVQASARASLVRSRSDRREPWAHHVARLGVIEVRGKASAPDLVRGFLAGGQRAALDPGAVSARLLDTVQASPMLDRSPPFRAPRTRFRFCVLPCDHRSPDCAAPPAGTAAERPRAGAGGGSTAGGGTASDGVPAVAGGAVSTVCHAEFVVVDDFVRTLLIQGGTEDLVPLVELCEDLAFHDWLLTTILRLVTVSRARGDRGGQVVGHLRPLIDHLLHLWMPGARVDLALLPVWSGLERQPGFSRQWDGLVGWIRDQLALSLLAQMSSRTGPGSGEQ